MKPLLTRIEPQRSAHEYVEDTTWTRGLESSTPRPSGVGRSRYPRPQSRFWRITEFHRKAITQGTSMDRREFLAGAVSATMMGAAAHAANLPAGAARGADGSGGPVAQEERPYPNLKPMALGLVIQPAQGPEKTIARVHDLGLSNCFLSMDAWLGKYSNSLAQQVKDLLEKYQVTATAAEVVGPGSLVWDFLKGPATIGLVPRAT